MDTASKIKSLQSRIESAKRSKAEADGAIKQILQDLQKEFGVKNAKEAKAKLEELQAEIENLNQQIEEKMNKLEEEFDL